MKYQHGRHYKRRVTVMLATLVLWVALSFASMAMTGIEAWVCLLLAACCGAFAGGVAFGRMNLFRQMIADGDDLFIVVSSRRPYRMTPIGVDRDFIAGRTDMVPIESFDIALLEAKQLDRSGRGAVVVPVGAKSICVPRSDPPKRQDHPTGVVIDADGVDVRDP